MTPATRAHAIAMLAVEGCAVSGIVVVMVREGDWSGGCVTEVATETSGSKDQTMMQQTARGDGSFQSGAVARSVVDTLGLEDSHARTKKPTSLHEAHPNSQRHCILVLLGL